MSAPFCTMPCVKSAPPARSSDQSQVAQLLAQEMAQKYGADTGRLYTLFAAPPEKDLEWSEESIEGSWRFMNRVYRLVERHAPTVRGGEKRKPERRGNRNGGKKSFAQSASDTAESDAGF